MSITQQQCLAHLQGMVRFPTVSHPDSRRMDFEPFFALHRYLEQLYPLCHQVLKKEVIGKAGLLYHWKGTGEPNRLPLLLMAHQDVVQLLAVIQRVVNEDGLAAGITEDSVDAGILECGDEGG